LEKYFGDIDMDDKLRREQSSFFGDKIRSGHVWHWPKETFLQTRLAQIRSEKRKRLYESDKR
jgi:hypothetical protein